MGDSSSDEELLDIQDPQSVGNLANTTLSDDDDAMSLDISLVNEMSDPEPEVEEEEYSNMLNEDPPERNSIVDDHGILSSEHDYDDSDSDSDSDYFTPIPNPSSSSTAPIPPTDLTTLSVAGRVVQRSTRRSGATTSTTSLAPRHSASRSAAATTPKPRPKKKSTPKRGHRKRKAKGPQKNKKIKFEVKEKKPSKPPNPITVYEILSKCYRSNIKDGCWESVKYCFKRDFPSRERDIPLYMSNNDFDKNDYYCLGEVAVIFEGQTPPSDFLRNSSEKVLRITGHYSSCFSGWHLSWTKLEVVSEIQLSPEDSMKNALEKKELIEKSQSQKKRDKKILISSDIPVNYIIHSVVAYPITFDEESIFHNRSAFSASSVWRKKSFVLLVKAINSDLKTLEMEVLISKSLILGSHRLPDAPLSAENSKVLFPMFGVSNTIRPDFRESATSPNYENICFLWSSKQSKANKEDILGMFRGLKPYQSVSSVDSQLCLQPDGLIPFLRPYQKDAVKWMLSREAYFGYNEPNYVSTILRKNVFKNIQLISSSEEIIPAYLNQHLGCISLQLPEVSVAHGGILADEMGLGKTLEVLSLILLHPRPANEYSTVSNADVGESTSDELIELSDEDSSSSCNSLGNPAGNVSRRNVIPRVNETDTSSVNNIQRSPSKSSKPIATIDLVRPLYEDELKRYQESQRNSPKFGGKFFETSIEKNPTFSCFCGGTESTRKKIVLKCDLCLSSHHAECVDQPRKAVLTNNKYLCPRCLVKNPIPGKSTLIITPNTISHQWMDEVKKHISSDALSVKFYEGVSCGYISPSKLASYDVVISTYNVLTRELNYANSIDTTTEEGKNFRRPKKFLAPPSPLTCVQWWRICLDEAQMVETTNSKVYEMAIQIPAINRWCVTGTPVSHGIQDLFGLFSFLNVDPLYDHFWWTELIKDPYKKGLVRDVFPIIGHWLWRNTKDEVKDQLGIPPQNEKTRWLHLSLVEKHFYRQHFKTCSKRILEKIDKMMRSYNRELLPEPQQAKIMNTLLCNLEKANLQSLVQPFLDLRKSCCHPQMVKTYSLSLQKTQVKKPQTMEELLQQLIKKTRLDCAEDHRQIIAALNGMAGIHILRENWSEAAENYREVLRTADKHKERFSTDTLQLLHTLENLADLLDRHHETIPCTLRDEKLRSEADVLRRKYLEKYAVGVKTAKVAVNNLTGEVERISGNIPDRGGSWFSMALTKISRNSKMEDLLNRVKLSLQEISKHHKMMTINERFTTPVGLKEVLIENVFKTEDLRRKVLKGITELETNDPKEFLHAAISCHLRKKLNSYYNDFAGGFRCQLCKYHDDFLEYECLLFKEDKKEKIVRTGRNYQKNKLLGENPEEVTEDLKEGLLIQEEEQLIESLEQVNVNLLLDLRRGTWGDSDTEKALKVIHQFSRSIGIEDYIINDGANHLKIYEAMKKEFRLLRILWRQIYDQISAFDELEQATTRMCLRIDTEEPSSSTGRRKAKMPKELLSAVNDDFKVQNINQLSAYELNAKLTQLEVELESGRERLSVHLGQVLYLESLRKSGYGKRGTANSEECPVCQNQLGQEWSVFRCGHSFCSECVKCLFTGNKQIVSCPLCREQTKFTEVSFVDTTFPTDEQSENDHIVKKNIRGNYSTKVEAVVELLLELRETHPGEKVIIFSDWSDVLEIISLGLVENGIGHVSMMKVSGRKYHEELNKFKSEDGCQAILMNIKSGSKGLNVIEASHVVLVEPILNLASEWQAIGRVHRIGQTKQTYVYRLCVRNTVEEQLQTLLFHSKSSSDSEGSLKVADLKKMMVEGSNFV